MTDNREILLSVKNMDVCFGKRNNRFKAVDNVSFDIYKGETFGLVGESGSGKTTIGRAIIRINPTTAGDVIFKGEKINGKISKTLDRQVTRQIQMIFQDPMASLNERAKVDYIVSEGLYSGARISEEERKRKVEKALMEVGLLPEFASRFPHEFSGGQRQRIGVARALIMQPEFIIADEPISALDVSIRAQVLNLLSKLQQERGLTYMFISHDLSVISKLCEKTAVMYCGGILETGPTRQVLAEPFHPYTRALAAAYPRLGGEWGSLQGIPGTMPDMSAPAAGCVFADRCSCCQARCREAVPELRQVAEQRWSACPMGVEMR